MGSKLNFVFSTCPPHFCCMFTILADVRKNRLLYVGKCWKFCKNPPCFPTHILWIKIFLTMDFDFLRYRGLQGTHMDAWKPSGIFWTKFVNLQQCAPPFYLPKSGVGGAIVPPPPCTSFTYAPESKSIKNMRIYSHLPNELACSLKGQLTSEWLFDVLNFPKKPKRKNLMNCLRTRVIACKSVSAGRLITSLSVKRFT